MTCTRKRLRIKTVRKLYDSLPCRKGGDGAHATFSRQRRDESTDNLLILGPICRFNTIPPNSYHGQLGLSGGQARVDSAALDVPPVSGIRWGDRCPQGRKAEDGPINPQNPLKETKSEEYPVRTEANVMEADGTLILRLVP